MSLVIPRPGPPWSDLIAGVDVSTKRLAIVRLRLDTGALYDTTVCEIAKDANPAELARTPAIVTLARKTSECRVAYYENPMGGNVKAVARLNRILGACQHATPRSIPIAELSPGEWKKLAGMKGNATKDVIARHGVKLYPDLAEHLEPALADYEKGKSARGVAAQDVLDAACIARAGYVECLANAPRQTDAERLAANA